MDLYVQYPDLTECTGIGYEARPNSWFKTEFAFGIAAPSQEGTILKNAGFKHVSSMNNWWPSHKGQDRELKLFWKKFEDRAPVPKGRVNRVRWECSKDGHYSYIGKNLGVSGCGFLIAEPPLVRESFYRYFTLLRMPLKVSNLRIKWLTANHFRLLDTGTLASYWCNGWEPKEWNIKMEREFFKDFKDIRYDTWPTGEYWQRERR